MIVASDGEADGADAGVEIENVIGDDVLFYLPKGHFVNWEVNLEKAVWGIGISVAEDGVGEVFKMRMRMVVFVKAARNLAGSIAAKEERLVFAGVFLSYV